MHYQYLILGGGMTADAAAKAIRKIDQNGGLCLISAESNPPYKRPPLTKSLWKGKPEDSIWLRTQELGVTLRLGRTVTTLDVPNKKLIGADGSEYTFDKLLLATGGAPRRLPIDSDRIIYYRTLDDYHNLRDLANTGDRFVVIGGGFIGSEIAAALAMNNKRVTMVFPDNGIGARIYPRELANFLIDYYREHGIEVFAGDTAVGLEERGTKHVLKTQAGREIEADGVVAGIGIELNTELAQAAGLRVTKGIEVDDLLSAGHPDIFAAGDVASFHNPVLDMRMRVEHEDNAVTMGGYAGRAMAGQAEPYHYLPYFYSDLFDLGYEAVGDLNITQNQTVVDWKEPFKEGVIYYVRDGRVRGVLLWNVWDKVPAARELIADPGPFTAEDLIGRIG